ncbi:MAG: hypothetical protein NUV53_01840 [Patescibacteria group bacterium]|nr:hypothetical protein [Patescibacteria group bacterium]
MKFFVYDVSDNLQTVMRRIGYHPLGHSDRGELNCVRPLAGQDYPRFHAYVKEDIGKILFSLHLDQKRPSYGGETAHSGDYESDVVQKESYRIQEVLILESRK